MTKEEFEKITGITFYELRRIVAQSNPCKTIPNNCAGCSYKIECMNKEISKQNDNSMLGS